jgi:hypothetical protein
VLVAERTAAVTLVCQTLSLFGHEVGNNHIRRGGKSGSDVAQLNMLATEVDAHVNVAGGRFVGGVKGHGDSACVIAE